MSRRGMLEMLRILGGIMYSGLGGYGVRHKDGVGFCQERCLHVFNVDNEYSYCQLTNLAINFHSCVCLPWVKWHLEHKRELFKKLIEKNSEIARLKCQ